MKKLIALLLAAVALIAASVPAMADAPVIEKVKYEGFGYVDVDFRGKVQYSDVNVAVTDASGTAYDATIWELDDDDISFNVANIAADTVYQFTVSGVRSGFSGDYESVTGSFAVPAAGELVIKEVDYDGEDRELEIEFRGRVQYKELTVAVQDENGGSYKTQIRERDDDSVEVRVDGLQRGETYTVTVSGVMLSGGEDYETARAVFTAY